MMLRQHLILAFGLCALAPMLGIRAEEKAPVLVASPSVLLSESHSGVVEFSPDGKYIAYSPSSERTVSHYLYILDAATKKVVHRLGRRPYSFTPDSSRLVFIYPVEKWEPLEARPPYKDDIYDRVKIPLHQLDVYDVKTGKRLHQIPLRRGQPFGTFPGGLATFSEEEKELFELRFVAEMPYKDISKMVEKPEGTLRVAALRLKERIQQEFI